MFIKASGIHIAVWEACYCCGEGLVAVRVVPPEEHWLLQKQTEDLSIVSADTSRERALVSSAEYVHTDAVARRGPNDRLGAPVIQHLLDQWRFETCPSMSHEAQAFGISTSKCHNTSRSTVTWLSASSRA